MINAMMYEATIRSSLAARRRPVTSDVARFESAPARWSRRRRYRLPGIGA
jgi:hypothetical protein